MQRAGIFGSLRGRLVMLALAVLIPAMGAASLLLWNAYQAGRSALERQLGDQARALGLVVDRQLGQDRVLLHALSSTRSLQNSDWLQFYETAENATPGPDTWVVVVDQTGRQLVNTKLPKGFRPGVAPSRASDWSSPLPDGSQVSNLFRAPPTPDPVVATRLLVQLRDGSQVRLGVARRAASFNAIWQDQKVPPTWLGVVLDNRMQVVTRSRHGSRFVGRTASPFAQRLLQERPEGVAESRTLDGVDSITAWSRSSRGGWYFVLAAPKTEIVGAATQRLMLGAATALVLLAAGVALAWWMGRSLAQSVEALTSAAQRLEAGERPDVKPSGIMEFDALGEAFSHSADRIARQQTELQELNASLEARVTERSRELEAATESLVQAQKLEAIGRLTGGVAHDFNNLLMAISGNLDLIRRRLHDDSLRRYIDQARQAADRGAKLTGQLLAFSRKQRLQPRPIDVNVVAAQSRDLLASTLGNAAVQTQLAADLWPALADATQLELVVMNLAINARDAMPDGGTVIIKTANVVRTEPGSDEAPPAGEFVRVSVTDTGSGMTSEVRRRAFEPFFTTKDVGQGSGLGLPQVLGLAKQLGGGVEIDTTIGRGTTVSVFLPRSEVEVSGTAEADDSATPDVKGLTVLLVDDDADVRGVSRAMLSEFGCSVLEASTGLEAIALAGRKGVIDVVLMDFAMPEMNGAETADRIVALRPGLPVVMMSGYAESELLGGRWSGPILRKPFGAGPLARELARAVSRPRQ